MAADGAIQSLENAVAVVGMAGRFPGAEDAGQFWENLRDGVESLSQLTERDFLRSGLLRSEWHDPGHRKLAFLLDGMDCFDAEFFGIAPADAARIDPQHRIFLECAQQCLEHAGHDPARDGESTGVYAGAYRNTYALTRQPVLSPLEAQHGWSGMIGADPDYLASRVAYQLNLKGPAVAVQCACSSGLAAVHWAAQALRAGECEAALAGAVSLMVPNEAGYRYTEGGVTSDDGHTRCFDARASGTVFSSAVACVLLKPLALARRDGNTVYAVVLGSAANNDGGPKRAFTAPDVDGQEAVMRAALKRAGVDPATVTYVEAHATGTQKGDPVEWEALRRVYGAANAGAGSCAVGGCKANIGHTTTVSGLAGLIKVVEMLRRRWIPPQILLSELNPEFVRDGSRLCVEREGRPWRMSEGLPLRAGVTSLGFGGTNVHVLLEEVPADPRGGEGKGPFFLPLSARTGDGLRRRRQELAAWLERFPETRLEDASFTLRMGRREFAFRDIVVASDLPSAVALLRAGKDTVVEPAEGRPRTIWLFPGHGAEYVRMGEGLYLRFSVFREVFEECAESLVRHGAPDPRETLYAGWSSGEAREPLRETAEIQPALFAVELALARLWEAFGLQPDAVLGYSVGEYAAAAIAGVMDLETAARLVAARALGAQATAEGGMVAAALQEKEALRDMPAGLSVAAVAAVDHVILAGTRSAVEEGARTFEARGVACKVLRVTRGFHSPLMEPMLRDFREVVRNSELKSPCLAVLSGSLGRLCDGSELTDPEYWVREVVDPIRFRDAVGAAMPTPDTVFLECGPGHGLGNLARRHPAAAKERSISVASLPALPVGSGGTRTEAEVAGMLQSCGVLWRRGVVLDWTPFDTGRDVRRVALPGYPFEKKRCWIDPPTREPGSEIQRPQKGLELLEWNVALDEGADIEESQEQAPARDQVESAVSADGLQGLLAGLLVELLGEPPSSPGDNFFDLGGNSLLAVQYVARVREALRVEVPVSTFLREPTVEAFTAVVEAALSGVEDPEERGATCAAPGRAAAAQAGVRQAATVQPIREPDRPASGEKDAEEAPDPLSFSVFFFEGEAGGEEARAPYSLLLDAARFADAQGFEAVWTPERHFNAFGGLYPNPALTGAAVAAVTHRIRIRGGSIIAPLHHPARIAEDWAVLDNLSGGRVDLCFAAGFHPNDFVFGSGSFEDRGPDTLRVLEEVQRLWKGGLVRDPDGTGRPLDKPVFPPPVQSELRFWLAATRHANTFVEAGRRGGNILTALLRLSLDELAERVALYRRERKGAGFDPAAGRVSLMIHAFAGESEQAVAETVAEPLRRYVRSHMEFLAPISGGAPKINDADAGDLMQFAVERFYRDCALFGTVNQCVERVSGLKEAGVDEIACLLDFGVGAEDVMASLRLLVEVRNRVKDKLRASRETRRHG